mmetsp:Transcript_62171/g.180274  ORF Transcript_62171/g.180274 Transcript_62171/m.180274 type:complete len:524 (+) Transcript_62171:58-1629(+)
MGQACCAIGEESPFDAFGDSAIKALVDDEFAKPSLKPLWVQDAEESTAKAASEPQRPRAEQWAFGAKFASEEGPGTSAPRKSAGGTSPPLPPPLTADARPPITADSPPAHDPVESGGQAAGEPQKQEAKKKRTRASPRAKPKGDVIVPAVAKVDGDVVPPSSAKIAGDGVAPRAKPKAKAKGGAAALTPPSPAASTATPLSGPPSPSSGAAPAPISAPPSPASAKSIVKVPPRLGQDYNQKVLTLKINIVGAKNLPNADSFGKSDPFCVCEIVGDKKSRFQTKVINDNCDPVWNHCVLLSGFGLNDKLRFEVWDKDTFAKNDLLGHIEIGRGKFVPYAFSGDLPLTPFGVGKAAPQQSTLRVHISVYSAHEPGSVGSSVEVQKYTPVASPLVQEQVPTVTVTFISAKRLRNADVSVNGLSDPYCICEIPGKQGSRIKTPVIKDCLDPVWNHSAQLVGFEIGDSLSFAVLDKDLFLKDDVLGRAALSSEDINNGFIGELELKDAGLGVKATLKVRVEISFAKPK